MPGPPPKKSRTTRTVLIVVGIVLLLCCLGGGVAGFWAYNAAKDATGPVQDVVAGYLDDSRAGNYPGAYARLCERERSDVTPEQFAQQEAALPKIDSYRITGVNVSTHNGQTTGTVQVKVTRAGGSTQGYIYPLVKENDEWRVCP